MPEPKLTYRAARRRRKPIPFPVNDPPPAPTGPTCSIEHCSGLAKWVPILTYQTAPMPGQSTTIFPARVQHPETQSIMVVCEACAQSPELALRLTSDAQSYSAVFGLCLRQGLPPPDKRYTKLLFEPARFAPARVDPE